MKLTSRRVRSMDELLAFEEKGPAVCGPSPSTFAARHSLKLSKQSVSFMRHLYRLLPNPAFAKNYFVEVAKTGDVSALRLAVDDLITALSIQHERTLKRRRDWSQCSSVERRPGKVSGAWVFKGTRVQVRALFENLQGGARVDDFLKWFPGVTRDHVDAVLKFTAQSLGDKRRGAVGLRAMRKLR